VARGAIITHVKQELARMGFTVMRSLETGGSTVSLAPPTAAQHLAAVLLGMDITLAGGEEACSDMTSIDEITEAASDIRRGVCSRGVCTPPTA